MTGVNNSNSTIPENYNLSQNYPNPFNPSTNISFSLPKQGFVKLTIFDATGREVSQIVNENLSAGNYSYSFNAANLSSGVYFYKLIVNDYVSVKKMTLIK